MSASLIRGDRVRLSDAGLASNGWNIGLYGDRLGFVVGRGARSNPWGKLVVTILWDGRRSSETIHCEFVELTPPDWREDGTPSSPAPSGGSAVGA